MTRARSVTVARGKGGFRYTEIGMLIQSDPRAASERLAARLRENDWNQAKTAKSMEIPLRTLVRWLKKLAGLGHPVRDAEARAEARLAKKVS